MGWSPVHALRIHIWYGYLAFVCMLLHGVILVPVWFMYYDFPVYQQLVPNPKCWTWTWTDETKAEIEPNCYHVFANWTGIVAAVFFIILWGSSLNWVRRNNYRLFYICHVVFGTLTILGIVLHMYWFLIYFIPSFLYYLASTAPTLIQALASRFRGGVKIRQVVLVEDSGGCVEVHVEAHETAHAVLNREPCQFIKLCVPKISLIWHPFDVYKSYKVDGTTDDTVRFLFRPVGPFTKELAKRLTSNVERPVTLVDGFYLGSDKTELAMQHDCVTMVAGGVALSPYLTLIPALLNRISKEEQVGGVKTKAIVLHWVCREPGLCKYYVNHYLKAILERARVLNSDATLVVHVYLTGGKVSNGKVAADTSELETVEGSSRLMEPSVANNGGSDHSPDDTEPVDANTSGSDQDKRSDDDRGDGDVTIIDSDSTGHPLELARVLPRRHSSPIWNLPFFAYFTGVFSFGIWYLFRELPDPYANYPVYSVSYYVFSKMTWITMYAVLMYFALGVLPEACVLAFRKYWPQPQPDSFDVVTGAAGTKVVDSSGSEDEFDEDGMIKVEDGNKLSSSDKVTLVYHEGRPTCDAIFMDARAAVEPGIFMCGPSALTRMVKTEASKENSYLGLTRYCLYDEPYEM
jgi:Ferric reductase like transmembrane component/Ferric reductase NAD binding domain